MPVDVQEHRGWKAGDKVTVKEAVAGYYSGYAGNPVFGFSPGTEGVIGAVKVPKVRCARGAAPGGACPYFICVDWLAPETGRTERCAVEYGNLVKVT